MDIQLLDWTRAKPLAEPIRIQVFIEEQSVPAAEEWDRWDAFSVHALAIKNGRAIGTARLTREGKVGRMAVLKEHRKTGVGTALMQALIDVAEERGIPELNLHAQDHAKDFYKAFGFKSVGTPFMECDISHIAMRKNLTQ